MICSAWQVCEPPDQAVRLEFEVAEGATVADAKRLVSIARPKWRVQAQMVGARLSGALGDGARLADHGGAGDEFLCWVACVCQRAPLTHLFLPPRLAAAAAAAEAGDDAAVARLREDVID